MKFQVQNSWAASICSINASSPESVWPCVTGDDNNRSCDKEISIKWRNLPPSLSINVRGNVYFQGLDWRLSHAKCFCRDTCPPRLKECRKRAKKRALCGALTPGFGGNEFTWQLQHVRASSPARLRLHLVATAVKSGTELHDAVLNPE